MNEILTGIWNILRIIATICCLYLLCLWVFTILYPEPEPKCAIYHGDFQNYTYDVPCDQVHSWCEGHDCEKTYGNCGRPTCFCNNTPGGRA